MYYVGRMTLVTLELSLIENWILTRYDIQHDWKKTISGVRVHVSPGSAETLVRRGGITNHHLIGYSLSNISAENYRNRLMCVEVIVCYTSVVLDTLYNTRLRLQTWCSCWWRQRCCCWFFRSYEVLFTISGRWRSSCRCKLVIDCNCTQLSHFTSNKEKMKALHIIIADECESICITCNTVNMAVATHAQKDIVLVENIC